MQTKNSCGGCTACCTTHGVESIGKPPHTPCSFCQEHRGCTIYTNRPDECQNFRCSWLVGNGGGDNRRPDKTGIVPRHRIVEDVGLFLILSEVWDGALNTEFVFKWTRRNTQKGNYTAHHTIQGNCRLYLPKGVRETTIDFESLWERKMDCIPYETALRGLVL